MLTTVITDNEAYSGIRVIKIKEVEDGMTIKPRVIITNLATGDEVRSSITIPTYAGNREMKKYFDKSVHATWRTYKNHKIIWPLPQDYILNLSDAKIN